MKRQDRTDRIPWRDSGVWLVSDTHVHYRLEGIEKILAGAEPHCDVIGFTEHAHMEAFSEQSHEIERMRDAYPQMVLINGAEYNTIDNQHAALLIPGNLDGMPLFEEFLGRFDAQVSNREVTEDDFLEGLRFLGSHGEDHLRPTVIFNNPKRNPEYWQDLIPRAFDCGPAVLGLCGSSRPPARGDREVWPWVGEIGGLYDRLLESGHDAVMTAESHVHRRDADKGGVEFWPGEFRRSYVYCPERSEAGFFSGLRSGASYFVLGGIVEDVNFTISSTAESAMNGECLAAPPASQVTVSVSLVEKTQLESIELIGDPNGTAASLARVSGDVLDRSAESTHWTTDITVPSSPSYYRIRGSAHIAEPYPVVAWFYTNPIWIQPTLS